MLLVVCIFGCVFGLLALHSLDNKHNKTNQF